MMPAEIFTDSKSLPDCMFLKIQYLPPVIPLQTAMHFVATNSLLHYDLVRIIILRFKIVKYTTVDYCMFTVNHIMLDHQLCNLSV